MHTSFDRIQFQTCHTHQRVPHPSCWHADVATMPLPRRCSSAMPTQMPGTSLVTPPSTMVCGEAATNASGLCAVRALMPCQTASEEQPFFLLPQRHVAYLSTWLLLHAMLLPHRVTPSCATIFWAKGHIGASRTEKAGTASTGPCCQER